MKRLTIIIASVALIVGCSSETDTQLHDTSQHPQNMIAQIKNNLNRNTIDTTKVKCEYNKKENCVEVSWKGKLMTISYDVYSKDIFGDGSNSRADGFIISMVLFNTGAKSVSCMEIKTLERSYLISPMEVNPVSDVIVAVGFGLSEESFRICMELLASSKRAIIAAKLHTDKGIIDIPVGDAINLKDMARSYINDGGKFE